MDILGNYRGGEPGNFWYKVAGWIFFPAAGALATRVLAPVFVNEKDSAAKQEQTITTVGGVFHALGAAGAFYASAHCFDGRSGKASPKTQAFFRGGMWSEMIATVMLPGASVATKQLEEKPLSPVSTAVVKGLDPKSNLDAMVILLTGGASKKAAKPKLYNKLAR